MNLLLLVPVISHVVGRDIQPEVDLFFRARAAIGNAQDEAGKVHFVQHWREVVGFMETEAGQEALSRFLGEWMAATAPEESVQVEDQLSGEE